MTSSTPRIPVLVYIVEVLFRQQAAPRSLLLTGMPTYIMPTIPSWVNLNKDF